MKGTRQRAGLIRLFRGFKRDQRGVTAIEFAAVGIPFFMLLFGLIEFGLAFFVNQALDHATFESSRLLRTGQARNFSKDQFATDLCENLSVLCVATRIEIDVRSFEDFAALADPDSLPDMTDASGKSTGTSSYTPGKASSIMVVRVLYRWPMFTSFTRMDAGDTGNMERLLYSTAVFRNEPYI
ncbi:TadE/TadG family type IV pilus assembly protein [Roseibium litorale]|uniref:Pilus assembly protein n=1 Tax=Roseibium litorale TaxID=2803841 RepID=A0ABR9CNV5_9HYPH|nr:TadE/TadG family type IV pilus assembly protein [Roseibium litorale]MBD8892329.1 pilus assembly protein [Roseibium litorale]